MGTSSMFERMRVAVVAGGLALAVAGGAHAAEGLPKRVTCTFASGTSLSYAAGAFQAKTPAPLTFAIDDIDLEAQSARLDAGEDGTARGRLNVVRAINANHFLEAVTEGFLNLTTVYDKDAATGAYPAVHSRHFGLLGQPVVSQYTGSCIAK